MAFMSTLPSGQCLLLATRKLQVLYSVKNNSISLTFVATKESQWDETMTSSAESPTPTQPLKLKKILYTICANVTTKGAMYILFHISSKVNFSSCSVTGHGI